MIGFLVGTLLLLIFLAWATWRSAQVLRLIPPTMNVLLLPAENVMRVLLVLVCIGLGWLSGLPFPQLGWGSAEPVRDGLAGLLIGGVIAMLVPPLTQWAVNRFGKQVYSPIVVRSVLPRNRQQWLLVPSALFLAVFLEEILFRSLLLGGFGSIAPPFLLALIWSIVFGVMHLPQGLLGMIVAAMLGLVFSILFLTTSSLLAPVVAHYIINLLQIGWAAHDRTWIESYE